MRVKFVPKELIETTLTLGGRSRQVLVQVVARYSLPSIIDTLHQHRNLLEPCGGG